MPHESISGGVFHVRVRQRPSCRHRQEPIHRPEVRQILEENELDWDEIYSAYYECEEDGTTTFYEAESADAGSPGIWTYMVYDCAAGEEKVVTNVDIDTLEPALQLQKLVGF